MSSQEAIWEDWRDRVSAGETLKSIADDYGVSMGVVYERVFSFDARRLTIDAPPFWGAQNRRYLGKMRVLSEQYRAYRTACVEACAGLEGFGGSLVKVQIDTYWPRKRRGGELEGVAMGDVDACVKATLDGLKHGGLYDDDAQVIEVIARKHYDKQNPRVVVRVSKA